MSVRDHRGELIALLVLVLVTAGILTTLLVVQGGDDGPTVQDTTTGTESDDTATASEKASEKPSEPAEEEPGDEPSEEPSGETAGVLVGDAPYVQPCGLVTKDDVQRIFGGLTVQSRVRQQYLGRTPTDDELAAADTRAKGGITTGCTYLFADTGNHTLDVAVTQFPSEGPLDKRWSSLRRDGKVVPATDGQMVRVPAQRSFVIRGDDFVVEVRYSSPADDFRNQPLSERALEFQLPRMRDVLVAVQKHLADGSATAGPQAVNAGFSSTWAGTAYVEPCDLLGDDAFAALGGAPVGPVSSNASYVPDAVSGDAPTTSCDRRGTVVSDGGQDRTTIGVLEVRLATSADAAGEMQATQLDSRYPKKTRIYRLATDAGTAYVVDVSSKGSTWHTRAIDLVVGSYELTLSGVRGLGPGQQSGKAVSDDELAAAISLVAAGLPQD